MVRWHRVDVERGKVYWTQKGAEKAGQGRIFRANLELPEGQTPANRQDIEVLYTTCPAEPIDLDLDLGNRIMLLDRPRMIRRAAIP